eukprot:9125777-Alexandrium_andersonii.AAC.1
MRHARDFAAAQEHVVGEVAALRLEGEDGPEDVAGDVALALLQEGTGLGADGLRKLDAVAPVAQDAPLASPEGVASRSASAQ